VHVAQMRKQPSQPPPNHHALCHPAGSGNLIPNTWSWHQSAHMLYVEQPAGA